MNQLFVPFLAAVLSLRLAAQMRSGTDANVAEHNYGAYGLRTLR